MTLFSSMVNPQPHIHLWGFPNIKQNHLAIEIVFTYFSCCWIIKICLLNTVIVMKTQWRFKFTMFDVISLLDFVLVTMCYKLLLTHC